jgi:hypothetical protein
MVKRVRREAGFVVSAEMLLIALIMVFGLLAGWARLRDLSAKEIQDSIEAVDAWIDNAPTYFQPHSQLWIVAAGVIQSSPTVPPSAAIGEQSAECGPLFTGEGTCVVTGKPGVTGPETLRYVPSDPLTGEF